MVVGKEKCEGTSATPRFASSVEDRERFGERVSGVRGSFDPTGCSVARLLARRANVYGVRMHGRRMMVAATYGACDSHGWPGSMAGVAWFLRESPIKSVTAGSVCAGHCNNHLLRNRDIRKEDPVSDKGGGMV